LVLAKDKDRIQVLLRYLRNNSEMKEMTCDMYLGFKVARNREKSEIVLHQSAFVDKVLKRFHMPQCNSVPTPEEVRVFNPEGSELLGEEFPFKEAIGSLLYLATCTRPDLAHAVSVASRTSKPTVAHWGLVKRILRYLAGTKDLGIHFRWEKLPDLVGFSDADYANDVATRRSTSGYVILYGPTAIAWRCQRQRIVTISTTEAEYVSGCDLVKDLMPIRNTLIELDMIRKKPTRVNIDDVSTIHIAMNEKGQQRTKHIDVREKWLNEHREVGNIELKFIPSNLQLADILTKPLSRVKFEANRSGIMSSLLSITLFLAVCVPAANAISFRPLALCSTVLRAIRISMETRSSILRPLN